MSNKRTEAETLAALSDALSDSIVGATDAEIMEEVVLLGLDSNVEARRVKALMMGTVKAFQQRALRDARVAYDALSKTTAQASRIPKTSGERRNLFAFVLTKQPQYAELFTAQHREFTDLTDADVESYLEDLEELGVLEKLQVDDGSK